MSSRLFAVPARAAAAFLIAAATIVITAGPALAHTEFDSSSPADGDSIDTPVSTISITFSGEAEPAGDGFVVLNASGEVRTPDEVTSADNLTWTFAFVEPLAGGAIGVRWRVAAPDAHPIEGSFSFDVTAAAVAPEPAPEAAPTVVPLAIEPEVVESAAALVIEEPILAVDDIALEDFLATSATASASGASGASAAGRLVTLLGAMIGIGGLVFAALVLGGERSDIRAVLFWTRRAGVMLVTGSLIEAVAQIAIVGGRWSSLWSPTALADFIASSFGAAVALRIIGGATLALGATLHTVEAANVPDPVASIKEFALTGARSNSGSFDLTPPTTMPHASWRFLHPDDHVWYARTGIGAFAGAAIVMASYLFDGHTVTEGPRWLHSIVNLAHVGSGAIWAGGVVMLAYVISRRHRRGADLRAMQLAVRFSVVAAVALTIAGVAGTALAVIVLDSVSELWSTPWGRLLMAKTAVVAVAAGAGAYNHFVLIPEMERAPGDDLIGHRFRVVATSEAAALLIVVVVTAFLVAASS